MTTATRKYRSREEVGDVENLCEYCSARCCRYFAMPIDTPDEAADLDFIRWYLLHEKATVFVEDDTWYLLVHTPCKFLREDNLCGIYEIRPQICRDYSTENCEFEDAWTYDKYFETPEQIAEYTEAVYGVGFGKGIRSPRPKRDDICELCSGTE